MPEPTPVAGMLNGENGLRVEMPCAVMVTTDSRALAMTPTRSLAWFELEAGCAATAVGAAVAAGAMEMNGPPPRAETMPKVSVLPITADIVATASRVRKLGPDRSADRPTGCAGGGATGLRSAGGAGGKPGAGSVGSRSWYMLPVLG